MFYAPAFAAPCRWQCLHASLQTGPSFWRYHHSRTFYGAPFLPSEQTWRWCLSPRTRLWSCQQMPSLVSRKLQRSNQNTLPFLVLLSLAQVALSFPPCGSVPKLTWPPYLRVGNPKNLTVIMSAPELDKILLFVSGILVGALIGALVGQFLPSKIADKL